MDDAFGTGVGKDNGGDITYALWDTVRVPELEEGIAKVGRVVEVNKMDRYPVLNVPQRQGTKVPILRRSIFRYLI